MAKLYNLARMSTATAGTGTLTLASAVSGFLTFALAGVPNDASTTVSYAIKDGVNSEIGVGVYTHPGLTLTRVVTKSTNANAAINLSGLAEVFITPRADEIVLGPGSSTLYAVPRWGGTDGRELTDSALKVLDNGRVRANSSDASTISYFFGPTEAGVDTRIAIASAGSGTRAALTLSNEINHVTVAFGHPATGTLGDATYLGEAFGVGFSGGGAYGIVLEHPDAGGAMNSGANSARGGNFGIMPAGSRIETRLQIGVFETPVIGRAQGAKIAVFGAGSNYGTFRDTTADIEVFYGVSGGSAGMIGTSTAHGFNVHIAGNVAATWSTDGVYTVGAYETPVITYAAGGMIGAHKAGACFIYARNNTDNCEAFFGGATGTVAAVFGSATNHPVSIHVNGSLVASFLTTGKLDMGASGANKQIINIADATNTDDAAALGQVGRVLLNTLTASNSANLFDVASFTAAYDTYEIVFENLVPANDLVGFGLRVTQDAGTWKNTGYVDVNASTTHVLLVGAGSVKNTAGRGLSGSVMITGINQTDRPKMVWGRTLYLSGAAATTICNVAGWYDTDTLAINGVQFFATTGNISTGKIRIYGVRT